MVELDISTSNLSEVIELVNILRESAMRILEKAPTTTAIEAAKLKSMSQDTKDYIPNEYIKLLFTAQLQLASYIKDSQRDEVLISLKNLTDSSFPLYSTPQTIKAIARIEKNYHNDGQLPPIRSVPIKTQVFTHKSSFEKYLTGSGMHNGRLAFLGESILRNCTTKLLLQNLKQFDEDELFIIRSKLINDVQLTKWVEMYQLNQNEAYLTHDSLQNFENSSSPYAELFKAYIGGLLEDDYDINYIESWLQTLIMPLIDTFNTTRISAPIDELAMLIGTGGSIIYETTSVDPYCVNVIINGKFCGTGTGSDFMRAKSSAAREALKNADISSNNSNTTRPNTPQFHTSTIPNFHPASSSSTIPNFHPASASSNIPNFHTTSTTSNIPNSHTASNIPTSTENMEPNVNISAKNDLYAILGKQSLVPEYEVNKVDNTFHAIVKCKNVILGKGKDRSKKWASQRAAMAALSNRAAIAKLIN